MERMILEKIIEEIAETFNWEKEKVLKLTFAQIAEIYRLIQEKAKTEVRLNQLKILYRTCIEARKEN